MKSDQMLLNMFKEKQYELTRDKIQGLVMLMSAVGMLIGVVLTAFLMEEQISMYMFIASVLFIAIAYLLQKIKVVSRNTGSLIYFSFLCFIFTPINWYVTNGILESTPYISMIVMLAIMIAFSGKTQTRIKVAYFLVVIVLVIYSIVTAPAAYLLTLLYKTAAFLVVISLMVFYMTYMFKRYDQMHEQFLRGSIKDELTRVLSRRVLDVVIEHVENEYKTKGTDYAMIMIDVDKFKQLNDEYGHVVGDIVLRNTAKCIKENTRDEDFVVRYGGDEFLAVLKGATNEGVLAILNRIEMEDKCKRLLDFQISVSRGFAKRSECDSPEALIELADQRMYKDKEAHR